jgi:hypothetical protein
MQTRRPTFGRSLTFTVGLIVSLFALLAAATGLGANENFIFYRLWHLSRSTTLKIGLLFILASLVPRPTVVVGAFRDFHLNLSAAIQAKIKKVEPAHRASTSLFLFSQLLLALALGIIAFWLDRRDLLGYIDGQYLLTLTRNQADFADYSFGFSSNPLQGLGDLWYFFNTRWIPELGIAHLISDVNWQPVAVHCTAFVEIFVVASFLSYWLGASPRSAPISGWLAVFIITPLTYPSLIYNVTADAPQIAFLSTLPLIIIPLLFYIGRGPLRSDAIRTIAVGLLLWLHFIAFGLFAALAYPFLGIVSIVFLAAAWTNKSDFWRKVAWGSALLVFLFVSGLPQILMGIVKDSAFHSFPELSPTSHDFSESSILLRRDDPIAFIFAWLGVIGVLYSVIFGQDRKRIFAAAVGSYIAIILLAALLYKLFGSSGAKPIYFEYSLWPIYPIYAASVLSAVWSSIWPSLAAVLDRLKIHGERLPLTALPLCAFIILHGPNYLHVVHNERPNVYPPTPTVLTEYLRNEIGLFPGASFRGRVATLTGQNLPSKMTWDRAFELDMDLIRAVGNDHRTIGLWYYSIPTLMEFNHTISSTWYTVAKNLLAYDDDIQVRNLLNMRRSNVHVLQLLGVRYVLTDSTLPAIGMQRVRDMPIPSHGTSLAIDEISNPNLGVSPTEIMPEPSNKQALAWMDDEKNDFTHVALLAGPEPGPLVAATDIGINVEPGGIRVQARSGGHSLIVIPFQFSHCLQAFSPTNGPLPQLRRTDLLLTGVLFDRSLDVTIRYRQGLFQGMQCRLDDSADYMNAAS